MTKNENCIFFKTLGFGTIRLAKDLVTKKRLQDLCQIKNLVLADDDGNEIEEKDGLYPSLDPSKQYTAVDEDLLDDEEEITDQELAIKKQQMYFQRAQAMTEARHRLIQELYKPLYPHLWNFSEDFFVPEMLAALKGPKDKMLNIFKKETETGIYSFRMFTDKFCRELVEELQHFEASGLPIMRPNSMNNYGAILDDFGFYPFFEKLREYIMPLSELLYGERGSKLDSHHAFIVQYKLTEDRDLDFHYDDSEVTLNICLGKQFEGGTLYFRGLLEDPKTHKEDFEFTHQPGIGLIHIGKHRHGANAIKSGERYNLIVWYRSSAQRMLQCQCGSSHDHHHDH
eukprot:TRINITY_DN72_c0_g1_i1.p1 TRINITY_DN72_c0_g1~~TRINITY_DN72_c0_g1_i1.p1  ORF type:complete len:348 (-),score=86.27 TRINITY_DN72_c0_g1_i1:47-1069(-)